MYEQQKSIGVVFSQGEGLHIRIKPLLFILCAGFFTLEGTNPKKAARGLLLEVPPFAQEFGDPCILKLLFKPLLDAVVGFVALFVRMDSHVAGLG